MKLLRIVFIFFIFTLLIPIVSAQTEEELTREYDITFPIGELDNCKSLDECRIFCDDVLNHTACINFAKSKGFYEEEVTEEQVQVLEEAKIALGCDSIDSCRQFCEEESNRGRCEVFAKKYRLIQSEAVTYSSEDAKLLEQVKGQLGCNSFDSCQALCEQEKNFQKCAGLAQQSVTQDDRVMFEKYKDKIREFLGCDSIVTCMAFCMNPANTQKCAELGSQIGDGTSQVSEEPGEIWCPKVAKEGEVCLWDSDQCTCWNPKECESYSGCKWTGTSCECSSTYVEESGEVWCPKVGSDCKWTGSECLCGSSGTTDTSTSESPEIWCPKAAQAGQVCSWDGSTCTCWDPATCTSPCTWTGSKCDCPAASADEPPEVWCPRNPGCSWTGTECRCFESTYESPEVSCSKSPGCNWSGSECQCIPVLDSPTSSPQPSPQVQGVSINGGLLQIITDYISRLLTK